MTTGIQAALHTYDKVMEACSEQVMRANYELAAAIREVLLPILHRWGMGMLLGGTLVYHQPSIKAIAAGKWEVHIDKDVNDLALLALHPEVYHALWGKLSLYPYDPKPTMHDFIMAIPLPGVDTEYIWITEDEDGHWDTITYEDSLNEPLHNLIYCGPITQAYWEDIRGQEVVGGFIDVLPAYKYIDNDFVRYYPWDESL